MAIERRNSLWILAAFGLAVCFPESSRSGLIETQAFDNASTASEAGWVGFRNNLNGNDFGFRGTDNTGGSSPAGEAGGTVARTTDLAYYADTTLGGTLDLNHPIAASGEFDITSFSFNNGIRIGHFDRLDTIGVFDFLGFQVAEPIPSTTNNIRIIADMFLSDGTRVGTATPFTITPNGDYTWTYEWLPSLNKLEVTFFDGSGTVGTSVLTLSTAQRTIGVTLNAFGISTGGLGSPSPTNVADVFIDNVAYTVAPEPASVILVVSGAFFLLVIRRWRA